MDDAGRDAFYPIMGQSKWKRLKKALLVWDPAMKLVKKSSNIPYVGKRITWFWDEDHFNQTMIPINQELAVDESTVLPVTVVEEMVKLSCHTVQMHLCLCRTACACEEFPMGLGCLFLGESPLFRLRPLAERLDERQVIHGVDPPHRLSHQPLVPHIALDEFGFARQVLSRRQVEDPDLPVHLQQALRQERARETRAARHQVHAAPPVFQRSASMITVHGRSDSPRPTRSGQRPFLPRKIVVTFVTTFLLILCWELEEM